MRSTRNNQQHSRCASLLCSPPACARDTTYHSLDPTDVPGLCHSQLVNRALYYKGSAGVLCWTELSIGTIQTSKQPAFVGLSSRDSGPVNSTVAIMELLRPFPSYPLIPCCLTQGIQAPMLPALLPHSLPVTSWRILSLWRFQAPSVGSHQALLSTWKPSVNDTPQATSWAHLFMSPPLPISTAKLEVSVFTNLDVLGN